MTDSMVSLAWALVAGCSSSTTIDDTSGGLGTVVGDGQCVIVDVGTQIESSDSSAVESRLPRVMTLVAGDKRPAMVPSSLPPGGALVATRDRPRQDADNVGSRPSRHSGADSDSNCEATDGGAP
jgi:hypothetical protein